MPYPNDGVHNCLLLYTDSIIAEYDDYMENNKKQYEMPDSSSVFLKELRSFKDDNEIERESQEVRIWCFMCLIA